MVRCKPNDLTRRSTPMGINIKLVHNPLYDSRKLNKRMHPQYPEMPIDSMRMTFLDFGNATSQSMGSIIQMLKLKDYYRWGFLQGTHGPTGPNKGGAVSVLLAGYEVFVETSGGIWIQDPSRCGELVYDYD